ncbi:MAG: response regulator transcription factor [Prevotella sp.]|nr:response regulator transcription factor [Prevotella sp.]
MEQKRILVVDDEQDLCDILLFNLTSAGYQAEAAYSAEEALDKISNLKSQLSNPFDLLLLDVMMTGMSGFELARRLKQDAQTTHIPIIFLTAKDTEDDTLRGFDIGADDYVTKPFSVREVLARVKAVLARAATTGEEQPERAAHEGLVMNNTQKTVTVDAEPVAFTRTEFDLLWLLLTHRGTVFSRQQLLEQVWPKDVIVTERTVDVNLARLRKKLGRYARCVVARQGYGYVYTEGKDKN